MSHLAIYLLGLATLSARASHSGLQDLAAFPKYEVYFLPDLPIAQSDASRCRRTGLAHDDDWLELRPKSRALDAGDSGKDDGENVSFDAPTTVQFMPLHYTPPGTDEISTYLCALPSLNVTESQVNDNARYEDDEPEPDPVASWQALSHLDGKCLYLRHAWFTYAYCHNSHLRQFRALQHDQYPHIAGSDPEEDPAFDAYSLGQAHPVSRKSKAALPPGQRRGAVPKGEVEPVAPPEAPAEQVSTFGVGPASRYLKQRWTDGTKCDKTGKPREVEVQVHCSMTSTDVLYMVKEITTCQYVVVIHSPHLCSLPGFRPSSSDHIVPAPIRCRLVVSDGEMEDWIDAGVAGEEKTWGGEVPRLPERPRDDVVKTDQPEDKTKAKEKAAQGAADAQLLLGKIDKDTIRQLEKVLGASFGLGDEEEDGLVKDEVEEVGVADDDAEDKPPLLIGAGSKPLQEPELIEFDLSALSADKEGRRVALKLLQQLIQAELAEGVDEAPVQVEKEDAAAAAGEKPKQKEEKQQPKGQKPPPSHDETLAAPALPAAVADAPPRDEL